ncbi:MAG: hypothetical protein ACYDBZ_18940 [Steroidobacteraceae bacterium]
MQKQPPSNHGEGNPEAAEQFNSAEREFVNSKRGKQKIQEGPKVRPEEQADLADAERVGRQHAKYDDSKRTAKK